MKKLFLTFLFVWTAASAVVFAHTDPTLPRYYIKGRVTDEKSLPISAVSVHVEGTTIYVGTNAKGEYLIQLREKRDLVLHFSFMGYDTQRIPVSMHQDAVLLPTVKLTPDNRLLNEVVVTGTRFAKPLKESPILTRIIAPEEIEALNPQNLETLLQYKLPGLQIGYNSMSGLPVIKYMGVGGAYLLFLIDGDRISGEGSDHNVDFSRFNIDDIDRIEVVKGAQSTAYGSNALGGVINVITKNANRPFTGKITARYAGKNGQRYTASVGVKRSRFSVFTSISRRWADTYDIEDAKGKEYLIIHPDGTTATETADPYKVSIYGYKIWDVIQKVGYTFTDKLSAEVKGSYYRNERDTAYGRKFQDIFSDYVLSAKLGYLIAEKQQIKISYNHDNYRKDKDFFKAGFIRTDLHNRQHMARADYSGEFGNHLLGAGLEFNHEYLQHYMLKDSAHASASTTALYLQEDWKIAKNLHAVAGLRADYHSRYKWHLSPKISILYSPFKWFSLRGGYSQGFRSPTIKELYQEYDMGGLGWFKIFGNPDLRPETSRQYALSAEMTFRHINFSVSGYHNRFKNKITTARYGSQSDIQYINAQKAKTTGIESILRWQALKRLIFTASYAYIHDYQEIQGRNTSTVRPHSISFNGVYTRKIGKIGTRFSLNAQWASKLVSYWYLPESKKFERVVYDPRLLCNLNAGMQLPRGISLSLGVDNIFNYKDKAADSSLQFPQKGISLMGSLIINLADMFKL